MKRKTPLKRSIRSIVPPILTGTSYVTKWEGQRKTSFSTSKIVKPDRPLLDQLHFLGQKRYQRTLIGRQYQVILSRWLLGSAGTLFYVKR